MTAPTEQLLQHIRRWASAAVVSPESDAALLDRFLHHRDEESFAALVRRHGPMVLGVCRRILGDAHDAEDAFQAAFLVLARKAAAVKPRHALAAFLYGVARRVALKTRTANIRRTRGAQPLTTTPADPHASPLDDLSARELLAIFEEELQRLPSAYRLPLVLCCLEGRSQEEAARQLGWTPGSVKGRLERGRARLHARLTRRGVTLAAALMAAEAMRGVVAGGLSASTVKAGLVFARGPVEGTAAVLAEGALRGMAWGKGALLAGLLTMTLAFAGAGVVTHQMLSGGTPETPKQAGTPPAQPESTSRPRSDRYGDPLPPGVIARLGTLRFRGVRGCLAFAPDDKQLAAATERGVTLWETATGREIRQIAAPAMYLSFSSDGKRLACCDNLTCHVHDVSNGKELFAVAGTHGIFAGNGKTLVTADCSISPSHVHVWDAATGRRLRQWPAGEWVEDLALAANGRMVAWTNRDKPLVQIRDMENDATKRSIRVGPHARSSLALTADGKMLALANNTGISLRDMADGEEIRAWSGRVANGAVFSPDSKRLAWIGFDERNRKAQLWTAERDSGKRRAIGEPVDNFGPPCFSPDGKLLAITTYHHVVLLRDAASGKEITSFDAHPSAVIDVAFSADGQQVVSHAHDGARFVWQTRSGKLLRRWPASPMKDEEVVLRLPKGRVVMTERQNNKEIYRVRELLTGGEKFRIDGWLGAGPRPTAAPGGRYLALRDLKGDLRVIDLQTGQSRSVAGPSQATHGLKLSADGDVAVWYDNLNKPLEVHVNRQSSAKKLVLRDMPKTDRWVWIFDRQPCVSPDGRWLVLSTEEGRLRRWDLTTGKEVSPLTEALRTTWELIWSPDGRFVAAQGAASPANVIDREAHRDLRVWDARAGARLAHLTVPNRQGGMHVHFSRDNRTMLTTDLQGIIHLWEIATGKERARLKGHLPYEIGALAVSADGRMLVSGGYDSQALVWDLTGRTPDGQWRTARHPPEKLRAAWKALASEDAKAAYAAMWQLVADPEGSVSLLRQQLRPIARPTAGQIARLIAELDSEKFTEREHAVHELEMLEEIAATELRQTLTRKPSLEVRRRVEALLERLNHSPTGAQLQALRAIETLEHIDTSEARQVLKMLAKGAPEARTTEEAKAARTRLERQSREQP